MTDTLESNGIKVHHHFGGGVYAKETVIPANRVLSQHIHPHAHLSILAVGRALVTSGDQQQEYEAPTCIVIPAGVKHSVVSVTPVVWYCIHATEDTDPATVDTSILTG